MRRKKASDLHREGSRASIGSMISIGLLCLAVGCGSGEPSGEETPKGAVPAAPTDVVAVRGDKSATVSWTEPARSDGEPITGYLVTSNTGVAYEANETSLEFVGLTNGTAYTFTVQAKNASGLSVASEPSNEVVPATVPGAPTILSATRGDRSVVLTWAAPKENGGEAVTGYVVTPSAGEPVKTSETTLTFDELTNGTAYTFTVQAENTVGPGAEATSGEVVPATVPGAPTIVSATRGDRSVVLTWAAPEENGGEAVTGYVVTSNLDESQDAAGTSHEFTGLTVGEPYTFTVQALNAIGPSLPSDSTEQVVVATVPGAPTNLAVQLGVGAATLTWEAPANDGGAPIHGYIVTVSDEREIAVDADEMTATVTQLEDGTPYTFDVVAVSEIGAGQAATSEEIVYVDYEWARWPLPPVSPTDYTSTADTVTDNVTQLVWQRTVPEDNFDWEGAKAYCAGLTLDGQDGWRLPTRIELESLVDRMRPSSPFLNTSHFAVPTQLSTWSSSTYAADPSQLAWYLTFSTGVSGTVAQTSAHAVRCVR